MPLALCVRLDGIEVDIGAKAIHGRGHGPPVVDGETVGAACVAFLAHRHPHVGFVVASVVVQLPSSFDESYHLFIAPSAVSHGTVGRRGRTSGGR